MIFEEYETPKTVNFIARFGPARGAWFKDPAGNVIGLREGPVPPPGRVAAPTSPVLIIPVKNAFPSDVRRASKIA